MFKGPLTLKILISDIVRFIMINVAAYTRLIERIPWDDELLLRSLMLNSCMNYNIVGHILCMKQCGNEEMTIGSTYTLVNMYFSFIWFYYD